MCEDEETVPRTQGHSEQLSGAGWGICVSHARLRVGRRVDEGMTSAFADACAVIRQKE